VFRAALKHGRRAEPLPPSQPADHLGGVLQRVTKDLDLGYEFPSVERSADSHRRLWISRRVSLDDRGGYRPNARFLLGHRCGRFRGLLGPSGRCPSGRVANGMVRRRACGRKKLKASFRGCSGLRPEPRGGCAPASPAEKLRPTSYEDIPKTSFALPLVGPGHSTSERNRGEELV